MTCGLSGSRWSRAQEVLDDASLQIRGRDRLDERHRARHRPGHGQRRRQRGPQRLRRCGRDRARAERHRGRVRRQGHPFGGRHGEAGRDRRHDPGGRDSLRGGRHPRQQCRHPARVADRGVPAREVGPDHRGQPVVRLSRHPGGGARHEAARLGPHHLDRLGPFPHRLALQGRLRLGQARHRRPHQDRRARARDARRHRELHQPRLCVDAPRRAADPRHHEDARPHPRAGHQRRHADGAADQAVRHRRAGGGASPSSCAPTRPARSRAPTCRWTAAGRRNERPRGLLRRRLAGVRRAQGREGGVARPAGRRRARRLHLGRARRHPRGRAARHRGDHRRQRRRHERGGARRRLDGGRTDAAPASSCASSGSASASTARCRRCSSSCSTASSARGASADRRINGSARGRAISAPTSSTRSTSILFATPSTP